VSYAAEPAAWTLKTLRTGANPAPCGRLVGASPGPFIFDIEVTMISAEFEELLSELDARLQAAPAVAKGGDRLDTDRQRWAQISARFAAKLDELADALTKRGHRADVTAEPDSLVFNLEMHHVHATFPIKFEIGTAKAEVIFLEKQRHPLNSIAVETAGKWLEVKLFDWILNLWRQYLPSERREVQFITRFTKNGIRSFVDYNARPN
jgi:hypothetical protein